ncbi:MULTISPECIES: hypothetical protein [Pseudomonas]|uniref:hypothetical protein n=1 Tax=Pseudomonas TaxID=286 RepID=UPI00287D575D|nr:MULTISPECIES: hypothetical protein [Pseudomonas]MDS9592384.1 hypothetical protein [Pseudomonas sp. HTZ1]WQE93244.1 hypothetical protein URF95_31765 [Pseudomonas aeruginosa]HBO6812411.1 hypothetical protein [Pseudomonas aeruginosa]
MDLMVLIQQALEASGKLRDLSKKLEDADFKMILADLHSALADAKLESGEVKMKLALAQEEIVRLKQVIEQRDKGKPTYNVSSKGICEKHRQVEYSIGKWKLAMTGWISTKQAPSRNSRVSGV